MREKERGEVLLREGRRGEKGRAGDGRTRVDGDGAPMNGGGENRGKEGDGAPIYLNGFCSCVNFFMQPSTTSDVHCGTLACV